MTMLKLILFDCDGVLIDSELISAECASEELAAVGMQLSAQEVLKRFLGRSRKEIASNARDAGHSVPVDFVERLESRISKCFEERLLPISDVKELLKRVNTPICVASGSSPSYLHQALERTGLLQSFGNNVFSATMVRHPKPAPDLFLYSAATMQVEPSQCLVVEDSMSGIAAARAAAMSVIGFIGGSHLKPDLVRADYYEAGCTAVFESMQELGTYLDGLGALRKP
jgi:HAD superfamily hydrolase (TIGR01509 family)